MVELRRVESPEQWATFGRLVADYLESLPFEIDFQDVEGELAELPAHYGPPDGVAFVATVRNQPLGCVGLRRFDDDTAELKRMWVAEAARGTGAGRRLAEAARAAAGAMGYRRLVLDTVEGMEAAVALYRSLGFREIPPYRPNPLPGAKRFGLELDT